MNSLAFYEVTFITSTTGAIDISPSYIKQKEKEIDKLHSSLKKIGSAKKLAKCASEIREVITSDRQLLKIAKRLFRQYFSETIDEILNHSETYSYNYCYIRHYDPNIQKKQKSDLKRKSKATGRIECGPFKMPAPEQQPYSKLVTGVATHLVKFMIKQGVKQKVKRE